MAFEFPDIYNFAPFFTLQPVDSTRTKQLEQWRQLIVAWHQHSKQTTLTVKEWPHWENKAIGRKLSDEAVAAVLEHVIAAGSGEWEDTSHARCKIFYKTPAEWAATIHDYIVSHGMASAGNLFTVYQLHSDGTFDDAPFHELDVFVLYKALEVLEKSGLAVLIPGSSMDEAGVKFKER